jgi:L-lactate dehydrogenase (cytochrome)
MLRVLFGKRRTFGNIDSYLKGKSVDESRVNWSQQHFDQTLSWRDIEWIRKLWPGKLVLKGIMDVDDAKTAVAVGADAIVVSNHGGRQLDGVPASIAALPDIATAVGDRIEVLFDGGIRSGQDVLKALALGARGCLFGRAFIYGLGAMGQAGVTKSLDIIRNELDISMILTGTRDLAKVSRDVLYDAAAAPAYPRN